MKAYKHKLETLAMATFPPATLEKESVGSLLAILTGHEDWKGVWAYDLFSQRIFARNPPMKLEAETGGLKNHDVAAVKTWLQALPKEKKTKHVDEAGNEDWKIVRVGCTASADTIVEAITLAAHANEFHPVRDYLDALDAMSVEDAHELLDWTTKDVLGIDDPMGWIKRQLVAAARRVRTPGYKHDYIVVLIGDQGRRKSTLVNALFDPWFQDNLPDLASRQAANALRGFWGIELAELEKLVRADDATAKAFLARREDVYDQKYEKDVVRVPRQCVFFGSTNNIECLRDPTGNRRYWPLRVERSIPIERIVENRDTVWRAANVIAASDFRTWMTDEEENAADVIRQEFFEVDPWHHAIARYCTGRATVTVDQVWEHLATTRRGKHDEQKGEIARLGKAERNRIGGTLRTLGCKRSNHVWKVPDELALRISVEAKPHQPHLELPFIDVAADEYVIKTGVC